MGYDLKDYKVFTTEMWVQEFAKTGWWTSHTTHTLEWTYVWFLFFKV